jgi:hypothetical protein
MCDRLQPLPAGCVFKTGIYDIFRPIKNILENIDLSQGHQVFLYLSGRLRPVPAEPIKTRHDWHPKNLIKNLITTVKNVATVMPLTVKNVALVKAKFFPTLNRRVASKEWRLTLVRQQILLSATSSDVEIGGGGRRRCRSIRLASRQS